jgi:Zn-dependent protease
MLDSKEATTILLVSIVLAFIISLVKSAQIFFYAVLAILAIILINLIAKKITSYFLDSEIKVKLWEVNRFGFSPGQHFKKPFAMGIFLPIILKLISAGYLNFMACLTFEVKPKIYRTAKRHGLYAFSEMTEAHIGKIAAAGIVANLIFAVVGYFTGFSEFAKLSIFYAAFNMIPISDLDGNKIFFGNIIQWSFLAAITFVGLGYVFFLI